jgi:hypothetical protein
MILEGNWTKLNESIWKKTFSEHILEPIEELEVRF